MFTETRAACLALASAVLLAPGCSRRPAPDHAAPAPAAGLSLSPEQRNRITVREVREAPFRRTIETTGTVAFDQNASTQVIAAISGPVARILTPPGTPVVAGQALAEVTSPDFAAALSGYRKAHAAAANLRRIADLDKKLFDAGGISRREMQQAETDLAGGEFRLRHHHRRECRHRQHRHLQQALWGFGVRRQGHVGKRRQRDNRE